MLIDRYNRRMDYLRVSVTDKCNLRCVYCMPPQGIEILPHQEVLRNEEFIRLIQLFEKLGIKKIRFTGGEPLVRKGFLDIVSATREQFPNMELCLTSNGILLGDFLDDLRRIELRKINISLDTLSRERYRAITGHDRFDCVCRNIERALEYDFFDVKVNSVLFKESLEELDATLDYFKDKKVTLRFIEKMPFGKEGREHSFVESGRLIEHLQSKGTLVRSSTDDTAVAVMFTLNYKEKYSIKIGVIPPMTHKFCDRCNRLRLTCDGVLKTCLHSPKEADLKTPTRLGRGDDELIAVILKAINEKPREHRLDCAADGGDGCAAIISNRNMSRIGG